MLLVAWSAIASPAPAQTAEARAKALFNAGVAAYKDAQFLAAAQAFMKARELVPKAELVFSIGQAFRRQFAIDPKPEYARMAYKHFREYVDQVKQGGKVVEAARALNELAAYAPEGASALAMQFPTRLSVRSNVTSAIVSLDGGPPRRMPYRAEVKPGAHAIKVEASGYESERRAIDVAQGEMVAIDVPLRGKPPRLEIRGADAAEVNVDGRSVGDTPFAIPLEVTPGRHFISVSSLGHKPYAAELDFKHGATTVVELDLPATNQRRIAYATVALGGLALAGGGVLAGVAYAKEREAKSIGDEQQAGAITEEQRLAHNDALSLRDDLRLAAIVTAGSGAAVAIAGVFLFLLDEPAIPAPRSAPDQGPTPEREPEVELVGGGLRVRF
jgi:hypothetical protein